MGTSRRTVDQLVEYCQQLTITTPVNASELKIALKELYVAQQDDGGIEALEALKVSIEKQLEDFGIAESTQEDQLINLLQFFKLFSEDSTCKLAPFTSSSSTVSKFATHVFPKLTVAIGKSAEGESLAASQKSSALLHKSVRISLNLVKNFATASNAKVAELEDFGLRFLKLLSEHPMAMLDVKCNAGLVICHLLQRESVDRVLASCLLSEDSFEGVNVLESQVWQFIQADYVNKVSVCFGALGTRQHYQVKFMENVAKVVLLQSTSNSTKEAVNLGSARILEIWMDKIVGSFPPGDLPQLSDVFPHVEIFIFTYMAGHIDAVKNCCRNMLSNLSVVYSRLDPSETLLKDLLEKVLLKPFHIKWVSLSAITRSNPQSVILLDMWTEVANELLCAERTFKNAAADVYLSLMKFSPLDTKWASTWISPLLQTQESQNNESNWSQKKTILTKALASPNKGIQQLILSTIITAMNSSKDLCTESWLLIVECLKIAVELGIELKNATVLDPEMTHNAKDAEKSHINDPDSKEKFRGVLPRDVLNSWTYHSNPQIRLASLSLLVDARKTSEVFAAPDFDALKQLFRYNLVSQNPAFRQQFFSYYKKLMRRLEDGRSYCKRTRREVDVANYDEFVGWLWRFFTREGLFAGASFSRRCQSLNCLVELLSHFSVENFQSLLSENEAMGFLRWLGDSYENNKIAAVQVLSQLKIPQFQDPDFVNETLQTAMTLLISVKPPESVTARYLLLLLLKASPLVYPWNILRMLLTQLEQINYTIKRKSKNLLEVSSSTPPYGIIRAIRLIFDSYKVEMIQDATSEERNNHRPMKSGSWPLKFNMLQEYVTRLLAVCFELDEVLFPVLGDAAPEGFLPELNENEKVVPENSKIVRSINAQMLLVSSWRSMKEICILLTELCVICPLEGEGELAVEKGKNKPKSNYVFKFDQVKSIGDHLLYLLMNLMHRGVFEQVFVGFKNLCARLKKSRATKLNTLSREWLQDIMAKVADKCTTRRSAGLPFIFQAILTPEAGNEQVMTYWMKKLIDPDFKEIMTVRIHNMNVLRALYRDATFSHAIMEWVPEGIQLAFRGLRAKEWAEQNSGLMLYGSVIRRTFGPRLNLLSAPTFFRKFPQMYDILLKEIKETASLLTTGDSLELKDNEFTYHLLLLFSCFSAAPGKLEEGNFLLSAFIPHIRACGASRDVQVRTIAAKALTPFITSSEERQRVLSSVLDDLIFYSRKLRNNRTHGDLLQLLAVLNLIKSHGEKIGDSSVEKLQQIIDLPKNTKCPVIFEMIANLSILLQEFHEPNLQTTCLSMQRINQETFQALYPATVRRHSVVGLPDADAAIALSQVFVDPGSVTEIASASTTLIDAILSALEAGNGNLNVTAEGLVQRYNQEVFEWDGQVDLELKYLKHFGSNRFDFEGSSEVEVEKLVKRMICICEGQYGTVECKGAALEVLAKIVFGCVNFKDAHVMEALTDILNEWTSSTADDELRYAAATALPNFPLNLDKLTPIHFCKIWTAALTLAQDDETSIRSQVYTKLNPENTIPACSLRCLELMVQEFFKQIQTIHTAHGLWTILGLILKDDYEVIATVADDEDEDRLFDRSEMNLYAERVTLTNIVTEYLKSNDDVRLEMAKTLDLPADPASIELFKDVSHMNLEVSSESKVKNVDFLKNILSGAVEESTSSDFKELIRGHEKSAVQSFIYKELRQVFQL